MVPELTVVITLPLASVVSDVASTEPPLATLAANASASAFTSASVPTPLQLGDTITLGLNAADFNTARAVAKAIADGADYLVIGRPITGAADPQAALQAIVTSLKGG